MSTQHTPATLYVAHCPAWCGGQHPLILTDQPDESDLEADHVIFHERIVCTDQDLGADVLLCLPETHPCCGWPDPGPRFQLWTDGALACELADPSALRAMAGLLCRAADLAEGMAQ